jgi:uncharacterized membrane protein YdjX (TVP38/TMEM64 family)
MTISVESFADIKHLFETDQLDDYIMQLFEQYESLGPLPGILLPMIEAFLPFLPLIAFVITNTIAYGLFEGFLYSWLGAVLGAFLVFWIVRKLGQKKFFNFLQKHKQVQNVMHWFERHGFGVLFLLICFPFSPSSIINIVAGLSRVSVQQFLLAVIMGKTVMIFTVAYVGESVTSFAEHPVQTIVVGISIVLFWIIGKIIEKKIQKKSNIEQVNTEKEKLEETQKAMVEPTKK